jgi:Male sterility protein
VPVQATAEVLALAEAIPQLRAFVHVSTAFVNGHQPQVRWMLGCMTCFSVQDLAATAAPAWCWICAGTMAICYALHALRAMCSAE